jgi:UDPglucose 6-dehydrogenase
LSPRHPDVAAMRKLMNQTVIFDGRNQYDPKRMEEDGFEYWGIGRKNGLRVSEVRIAKVS